MGSRLPSTDRAARTSVATAGSNLAMKAASCLAGEADCSAVDTRFTIGSCSRPPLPAHSSVRPAHYRDCLRLRGCRAPFLRSHIRYVLREGPAMARVILGGVLPLPERHVGGWRQNTRTKLLCMITVVVDVVARTSAGMKDGSNVRPSSDGGTRTFRRSPTRMPVTASSTPETGGSIHGLSAC